MFPGSVRDGGVGVSLELKYSGVCLFSLRLRVYFRGAHSQPSNREIHPPPLRPCVALLSAAVNLGWQVIQYINLVKSDDIAEPNDDSFTSTGGKQFPWLPADEFEYDYKAGHGTHTAGSAAGATLNNPAVLVTCEPGKVMGCVGGCIDETAQDDDLAASYLDFADIDRLCPAFGCDETDPACLSDDVSETLTKNGGVAQGAKLAIFDVFYETYGLLDHIGNGLWEPCVEADCKLHSNSWGSDNGCETTPMDLLYDEFMYEVRWRGVSWCLAPWFEVGVGLKNTNSIAAPSYHIFARTTAPSVGRRLCAHSSCAHLRANAIVGDGAKEGTV